MSALKQILLFAAVCVLTVSAANSQEYTFKLHHFLSAQSPAHKRMLQPWAKQVEENSGGKVAIEIYPSMSLGGRPAELVGQAWEGVVDLVWTVNGYTPGLFPRTEVMELPFVYVNDPVAANLSLYDMFESELAQEYVGLEVMFLHVHAGQGIHMRNRVVRSPRELKGMKIRIPTRTGAWSIEALGASPVSMPVTDLPQALQKEAVDGAFIPWEIIPSLEIHEQTQYQIEGFNGARFGTTTFQVSMNASRWNSLPADVQFAFKEASGRDWWGEVGEIWQASDDIGIGVAEDAGNEHIVLSKAETSEFQSALEPVVSRWISEVNEKGIDGVRLVETARELISRNAR